MSNKKTDNGLELSTEQKIKAAARKVFHKKGFAATRTRDIAEEAEINLALLNYYFKSKQKLFDIIMLETLHEFLFGVVAGIVNDPKTSLEEKVAAISSAYIDKLIEEPQVALFVLSELRMNPNTSLLAQKLKSVLSDSMIIAQFQQAIGTGRIHRIDFVHFIINVVGLIVFPFIGAPILKDIGGKNEDEFKDLMLERKKLIPIWINAMFKV
ncbi:TetR/AcrR family transcriptional regulator [uncultured Proteiniphilum sp.]|uniref:TetR/AcrR family transcriptional regulator n=1 Tax=uncultured Proteiniphilum sp. TaxID=497637 RepID=UPI0026280635|nr:TetR/AcrR family transcriptional regulator [uncultured Proteiniphilum sp.]